MTKDQLFNTAFNCGKDNFLSPYAMPVEYKAFTTDEWDAGQVWFDGWTSGEEYARHAAAETVPEEWLHNEDYLDFVDCYR